MACLEEKDHVTHCKKNWNLFLFWNTLFELVFNTEWPMKSLVLKQVFEVSFDLVGGKKWEAQESPHPHVKFWLVD